MMNYARSVLNTSSLQFIFLLWVLHLNAQISADCIWYGECGQSPNVESMKLNCKYTGPAKPLTNGTVLKMFKEMCPHLYKTKGTTYTCCNEDQISAFYTSGGFGIVKQIIGRCPACFYNFKNYQCAMMCNPDQQKFLHILTEDKSTDDKNPQIPILSIQYYVSHSYMTKIFKSCESVMSPFGGHALDLLCGRDVSLCSGKIWAESMGESPFAPFLVKATVSKQKSIDEHGKTFIPFSQETVGCDKPLQTEAVKGSYTFSCTCGDCPAACKKFSSPFDLPQPPTSSVIMFGKYDGMTIVACVTYCVIVILFLLGLGIKKCLRYKAKKRAERPISVEDIASVDRSDKRDKAQQTGEKQSEGSVLDPVGAKYRDCAFKFEDKVEGFFTRWGTFVAKHPFIFIIVGLVISCGLSAGLVKFSVTTDPVELWAMPTSRARKEMEYYNAHFDPYFRSEQVIMKPKTAGSFDYNGTTFSNVFRRDFLYEAYQLQTSIETLKFQGSKKSLVLKDVCYQPMAPENDNCTVFSVINYFPDANASLNEDNMNYLQHIDSCTKAPFTPPCLGPFGGPILPFTALGGFLKDNYARAEVLVLTILLRTSGGKKKMADALLWETKFLEFMAKYKSKRMEVFYLASKSIQDEFDKESKSDISTVTISYLIMFAYISIGLGKVSSCRRILIDSKMTLGVCGVLIVILSVMTSIGMFSLLHVPATLIVIEVVPFMVLAVGVDNLFILVQSYQRDERQPGETREQQIGRVVGDVAPSMMLSSVTDAAGFFLGAITSMPAVRTFALYAGVALIVAFMLQMTCFIGVFALDTRRQENNRLDFCCCCKCVTSESAPTRPNFVYRMFDKIYAPFLMKPFVRYFVILIFPLWFCTSLAVVNKIEVGLDQELATAEGSYVSKYLTALKEYLEVGPPTFFVIKDGYDYSSWDGQISVCKGPTCKQDSILNQITYARQNARTTYIAADAFSWIDDYLNWVSKPDCCRRDKKSKQFCSSLNYTCTECDVLPSLLDIGGYKHVVGKAFEEFLPAFLKDNPTMDGCVGGHALHANNVELKKGKVGATAYMTFHTILKSSKDYYEAVWYSRYISDRLTEYLNKQFPKANKKPFEVFAYSYFYVFYEQYLTMWEDTMFNLLFSFIAIYIIAFLLLGMDFILSLIIVTAIFMIVVNLMGIMYWWHVQLNAVSLVNLVVAIGIAVEFCSHITRAFAISQAENNILRSKEALVTMGSSVLSGITLTKFTGISVLAFSRSQIFRVFYFRINLCIVLFGAAHGLIFLPVLLSFFVIIVLILFYNILKGLLSTSENCTYKSKKM